ncbi:TonB-dependent receptor [Microbulbifer sp. PSTR4-B]|uniref:TonB-dependent receptor n=1 Tax=Microbulbifer sp. PSTR4-B TaxID=3243396 RepID=UPI00403A15D1
MGNFLTVKHWVTAFLALMLSANSAADALCPKPRIELPASSLPEALISLGRQCQVSILVPTSSASLYQLPKQTLSTGQNQFEATIEQLLEGLPFSYHRIGPTSFAVTPNKESPPRSEQQSSKAPEEITVTGQSLTGSHLRHYQLDGYAPIDRLTREQLELTGAQTVADVLKFLPAISGNSTSTSVSQQDDGTATVSLRYLPASNTLVLINGRRIIGDGYNGEATDLNTIPLSLVERVEILKDGASAVYGSDAIAGVINIILRKDFEGLSLDSYYGQSGAGDRETESHHLTWGRHGERGHIMLNLAQYTQGSIMSRDRNLSESADSRDFGGTDKRSSATPEGFIALDNGATLTSQTSNNYRDWSLEDRYNYNDHTSAVTPLKSNSAYLSANFDLSDNLLLFAEAMGLRTSAESTKAPSPVFTRFDNGDLTIAADNIYNPFNQTITDVRKRITELGPRIQKNRTATWRLNTGIKGVYNQWHWELNTSLQRAKKSEKLSNLINPLALSQGLKGPTSCNSSNACTPINLLGPSGSIPQEQLEFIRGTSTTNSRTRMESLTFISDGSLGETRAGEILAAAGFEIRHETLTSDSNDLNGLSYIGGHSPGATRGSRTIKETFAEVSIPIQEEKLWLDGAVRLSSYSDFGNTYNPKLAIRWQVLEDLNLRVSYASGFRAPTLTDMYQKGYQSQEFIFDPCTSKSASTLTGCPGQSDSARIQYLTEFGGNPSLTPETSKTLTASLAWTPEHIEGLSSAVEIFNIQQEDVIGSNPQFLVEQNAYAGLFSDRVLRDEQGEITKILATRINQGRRTIRGYDVALRYDLPEDELGQFKLAMNISHMLDYLNQGAAGLPEEELSGTFVDITTGGAGSLPEFKANAGIYWSSNQWKAGYTVHFVGSTKETYTHNDKIITHDIGSWFSHDAQLSFNPSSRFRFSIGVNNLLNTPPPLAVTATENNFDHRTYDLTGRYWYSSFSFSL